MRPVGLMLRSVSGLSLTAVLWLGFIARPVKAANPTGTIVGTVTDASGAVVPDATVTVTHQATGASRNLKTDATGSFNFRSLAIGNYTLKVEMAGFKTFLQQDIVLQIDQNLTLPVVLQLGAVTLELTVTGTTSGVDLVKATIHEVVDQRRIVDLPLNGRDPLQLVSLMPGVGIDLDVVDHGQGQHSGMVVNGNRPASNYFLLDGIDAVDSYLAVAPTFPSPDALQEFTVHTSEFSAEYGRNAGALVNAATRSGTNDIHGTLFEFLRNDHLNAADFFTNRAGAIKPPFKLNQYGGTIGGPIRKGKTFYFGYFQQTARRFSRATTIPDLLTRQERPDLNPNGVADFNDICPGSRCPIDPRTGQPFPSNIIPANRIDPVAFNLFKAMPLPNSGRSFTFSFPSADKNDSLDETQLTGRLDHFFNDNNRVFGRYFFNNDRISGIRGNIPGLLFEKRFRNQNLGLNWFRTFSPTFMNTVTLGLNRMAHTRGPLGTFSWESLGGPCNAFGCGKGPKENIQIGVSGSLGNSGSSFGQPRTDLEVGDTVTWIRGKHSVKFGGDIRREGVNRFENFLTDPTISFSGFATKNPLADALLGLPSSGRQDAQVVSELRHTALATFIEDDLKVKSNLTANLGLRWEPYLPPVDNLNDQLCFDPTFTKRSSFYPTAPPGILFPSGPQGRGFGKGDAACPRQLIPRRWANFAPRVGLVWDPFKKGKTSVRASYGIFWDQIRLIGYNRFSTAAPFDQPQLFFSPGNPKNNWAPSLAGNSIYTNSGLVNPFPAPIPRSSQDRAAFSPLFGGNWPAFALEDVLNPDWNEAYIQEYNFSIQQELFKDYTLAVAFVGNKATHLPISREYNWAVPLPLSVQSAAIQRSTTNARRRFSAITCADGKGNLKPCYGNFELEDIGAYSNYNSLQATINRKFSHGLTLLGSYVWSKYMDIFSFEGEGNSGPRIPFNFAADYGPSDNDITHRFVVSYIWQVPKFSRYSQGVINQVVNGWQINGITIIQSGTPFTVFSGIDKSLTSIGKDHPDAMPGVSPLLSTSRSHNDLINQYFNTAAFQQPADGSYGNVARNTLRGPGIINFDFAIFKDFRISERWGKIEFRNEYFNLFNRVTFANPGGTLPAGNYGKITATLGSVVGSTSAVGNPRFIQVALKWIF